MPVLFMIAGVLQQVDGQNNVLVDGIADAWGRTTQETGAGGDQVDITYDAWSRVESVTSRMSKDCLLLPSPPTATRTVHTASGNVRWEERWDGLGRIVSSTNDLDHALTVTYPSPTSRVITQRGPDGSNIVTTEHLNDFGGVLQQVDGQNNVLVDRITDAWGRTTQETGAGGDQVDVVQCARSKVTATVLLDLR